MTTTSEETIEGQVEPDPHGSVTSADELSEDTRALMSDMIKQGLGIEDEGEEAAPEPEATPEAAPAPEDPAPELAPPPEVDTSAHTDGMAKLAAKEKEIDDKRLEVREREKRVEEHQRQMEAWKTDRLSTLRGVMEVAGITDPEAQKAELKQLYEEMTYNVLGVEPDQETSDARRALAESAKLRHKLELVQQEQAEAEKRREEAAAREETQRQIGEAVKSIGGYLNDTSHDRPFLMAASDDPGKIVWSVLSEAADQGQELTLKEAADKADAHFKAEAERYRHLLTIDNTAEQTKPSEQAAPASNPGSKTLTNATASTAPPPQKAVKPGDLEDEEEARKASWEQLQKMVKAAESEP